MSKRFVRCGAAFAAAAVAVAIGAAGAGAATPAVTNATLDVTTVVDNSGHGSAAPDSFVFHVFRTSDHADVLDGIWNHNGHTTIKLPPGTYSITENPLAPFSEHLTHCTNVTITTAHATSCTISNVWTLPRITVSTTVTNAGGGTADASSFHYSVMNTDTSAIVKTGTFSAGGTTHIDLGDGTYTISEDQLDGYIEDVSQYANLVVDYQHPAVCTIANTFDPHSTTTGGNPTTTVGSGKQVTVHSDVTNKTSCLLTLEPALQEPSTTNVLVTFVTDADPSPHEGDTIHLTNTSVSINTPADMIQTGVDLGVINAGDKIPENVTMVIGGDGTKEGSHTYTFKVTLKIVVKNGKAQPLIATAGLPDTTWTPSNSSDPVFFTQKSVVLKSTINSAALGGPVQSTFTCSTPNGLSVLSIIAQPGQVATTTTAGPGGGGGSGGTTGGTGTGGTLPVTGMNPWWWLAIAIGLIDIGLFALGATARGRRRVLDQ